jgi:hypothetical protein
MKKLMAVIVLATAVGLWATSAFASGYASLDGNDSQVSVGAGGIFLSGNDAAGGSETDFLPTVNVSGLAQDWEWQVFYAFGSGENVFGGNVDYILASSFDNCATCQNSDGNWWFGVGPTVVSLSSVLQDAAGANGVSGTDWGGNLGFGWTSNDWSFDLFAHYLVDNQVWAGQASINYNFN